MNLKVIPALLLATFSGASMAAGFAIQAQNGSNNGNAFAGAAAAAEDAGTIFFNPAGMAYLPEGGNVSVGATYLKRSIEFTDQGTARLALPGPTFYNLGSTGGDAGGSAVIPAGYVSYSLNKSLSVGLGISPTFGNKTEYTEDFIGRFSGYYADLQVININPSVSYKLNDMVSLGAGINYSSADIEFRQKAPVAAALPAAVEADLRLKGDDKGWGYNFGAMFQAAPDTRVGVTYRSSIKLGLEGNLAQSALGTTTNTAIKADLELPDSWSVAVSQKFGDKIEVLADYTRTNWSKIQSIVVTSAASGARITSLDYNFKDSARVGLGVNYRLNEGLKLRAGVAVDKTPVQSAADTTMTLPDSDRTWLSFGAKFNLTKANSIDVGYSHIFFKEASTQRAVKSGSTTLQTVKGTFDTSADYLSLQYNHNF
jgi:long-chain fatty acid transport protein